MEDVQGRGDSRGIPINHAGVSDLAYPIVVLDRAQERQHTIAKIAMSVALPRDFKGTHMSRFIEVLGGWCPTSAIWQHDHSVTPEGHEGWPQDGPPRLVGEP
jgi:GTP cyclohydrolase FolE2